MGETYNLAYCLTGRLYTTPGRDVLALDNLRTSWCELLDEAFVRHDTAIKTDFYARDNFSKLIALAVEGMVTYGIRPATH